MDSRGLLKKANEIRVRDHRLKPSLRLRTKEDAIGFIHDRGLVSFFGGNELPSFISAVLGRSWKPSKKGFAGWNEWWSVKISGQPIASASREIEARNDILASRLFRRTKTLVSSKVWQSLDPVVRHHRELLEKGEILSDFERRLLRTIEREKSIRTDHLRKTLRLEAKENNSRFHRALTSLENYALIVGVEDPAPEKHLHANRWQTWESKTGGATRAQLSYEEGLAELLEITINACVIAPENEVAKWFPWGKDMSVAKQKLLDKNRLLKQGSLLVSPIAARSVARSSAN